MEPYRILIVEEDDSIAHTLERSLLQQGWQVVGIAKSYAEAVELYLQKSPNLVLFDTCLNGSQKGIELAQFIRDQIHPVPFIFLASQFDRRSLNRAKKTHPAGFLVKPLQPTSLYATIEIAMHTHFASQKEELNITLVDGKKRINLPVDEILYIKTDHVYLQVVTKDRRPILLRFSLSEFMKKLPVKQLIRDASKLCRECRSGFALGQSGNLYQWRDDPCQ